MIRLANALNAWSAPAFEDVLKKEIEGLGSSLPLQAAMSERSYALYDNISVMIISFSEEPGVIRAKTGIFYTGVISGCSCADDPTPVDEHSEYCEMEFVIDKKTAETTVVLLHG